MLGEGALRLPWRWRTDRMVVRRMWMGHQGKRKAPSQPNPTPCPYLGPFALVGPSFQDLPVKGAGSLLCCPYFSWDMSLLALASCPIFCNKSLYALKTLMRKGLVGASPCLTIVTALLRSGSASA